MKLDIENYNLNYEQDINDLTKITELLNSLKDNIKSKYYEPYQNFLKKLKNIMNMLYNQFEKELDECKKNITQNELTKINDDNDDNDDTISITSISSYGDENNNDIEEIKQIELFEYNTEKKLDETFDRFEFEFEFEYNKI